MLQRGSMRVCPMLNWWCMTYKSTDINHALGRNQELPAVSLDVVLSQKQQVVHLSHSWPFPTYKGRVCTTPDTGQLFVDTPLDDALW